MRRLVVCLSVLLVGVGCSGSATKPGRPAATRSPSGPAQTAHEVASTILGAVALPANARPYQGALPPILTKVSAGTPAVANLVDEHRAWTVQESASSLRSFEFATAEHGFEPQGAAGYTDTEAGKAWTFETEFLHLPLNVALAQLDVDVADRVGGGAVIRVDALVSWTPAKPAAEYVPIDDHVVILTAMHPSSPPSVFRRVAINDPHRFAALAASFNRVRLGAIVIRQECGPSQVFVPDLGGYAEGGETIDEVAFSTDTHTKPNLIVVLPICRGVGVRANGVLEPALTDNGTFLSAVKHELTPHT